MTIELNLMVTSQYKKTALNTFSSVSVGIKFVKFGQADDAVDQRLKETDFDELHDSYVEMFIGLW